MRKINTYRFEIILFLLYFLLAAIIQFVYTQHFIADDSYFYMTVARNIALSGQQTFSGIVPTNGVHPLWLYVLSLYSWISSLINSNYIYQPVSVIPISAMVLGSAAWFSWKSAHILGINRFVFTALPIGFLTTFPLLGSEAYVFYFCLSLLTLTAISSIGDTRYGHVLIGLTAALTFLARLDSIFFIVSFYLWYWITQKDFKRVCVSGAVAALPALIYMISNQVYFGSFFPISGWLKSSFPNPLIIGFVWNGVSTRVLGYNLFFGVFPLVVSTLILGLCRRSIPRQATVVYAFWGGSVMHFVYTGGFTVADALWYYVLPVVLVTFAVALALRRFELSQRPAFSFLVFLGIVFSLVGYAIRDAVRHSPGEGECETIYDYLVNNHIAHETIIAVDCPGQQAFRTTNHVIALDMLTANRRFVEDMRDSPNGFQFILDQAAREDKPATYLIWTTNTWLGALAPDRSLNTVSYLFRYPDEGAYRYVGTITSGRPLTIRPDLVVWKIPESANVPAPLNPD
jgi:hypothetical protein